MHRHIGILARPISLVVLLAVGAASADEPQPKLVLRGHKGEVAGLAFTPDGKILASGGALDKTTRLWDAVEGKERAILQEQDGVSAVAISPDGRTLATAATTQSLFPKSYGHGTVTLWDLPEGKKRLLLTDPRSDTCYGSARFSPDGRLLGAIRYNARDHFLLLWDLTNGKERPTLSLARTGGSDRWQDFMVFAFSPDWRFAAFGSAPDHTIAIIDLEAGKGVARLKGHTRRANSAAFSPNAKWLATSAMDNTVRVWYVSTWKPVAVFKDLKTTADRVAYSPDSAILAASCWDGTIRLWEASTNRQRKVFKAYPKYARTLAFSPDGSRLATGDETGLIKIWDVSELLAEDRDGRPRGEREGELSPNEPVPAGRPR